MPRGRFVYHYAQQALQRNLRPVHWATLERQARQELGRLQAAAATLAARGDGVLPRTQFQLATSAADWLLLRTQQDFGLLYLVWGTEEAQIALLQLHAATVRQLASPTFFSAVSPADRQSYSKLHFALAGLLVFLLFKCDAGNGDSDDEGDEDELRLRNIALDVAELAVRMDMLHAYSALLAAAQADTRRRLTQPQRHAVHTLVTCILDSIKSLDDRSFTYLGHSEPGSSFDSAEVGEGYASDMFRAVARSSVLEHCVQEATQAACGAGGGAPVQYGSVTINGGGQRLCSEERAIAARELMALLAQLCDMLSQLDVLCRNDCVGEMCRYCGTCSCGDDDGGSDNVGSDCGGGDNGSNGAGGDETDQAGGSRQGGPAEANGGCSREGCRDSHVSGGSDGGCSGSDDDDDVDGSAASDGSSACPSCANLVYSRTILSGPCLQYALAAHVVGQLAAADGDSTYGLPPAQLPPPVVLVVESPGGKGVMEDAHQESRRRRGGRRTADESVRVLQRGGMLSAVRIWSACFLRAPAVPLSPCSRRAVHTLSMRIVRLAILSSEYHTAWRQLAEERRAQQGAGGRGGSSRGDGPALLRAWPPTRAVVMPLQEVDCTLMALEGLRCAALSARPRIALYGGAREAARPGDSSAAAAAAAARYWGVAVPALHMVVTHGVESVGGELPLPQLATDALQLDVPCWPAGDLPPAPPPNLSAALSAGYLPLLERGLRAHVLATLRERRPTAAASKLRALCSDWRLVGRLMAYGEPRQVAAWVTTVSKLINIAADGIDGGDDAGDTAAAGGGAEAGGGADGAAASADRSPVRRVPVELLAGHVYTLPLAEMLDWLCKYVAVRKADARRRTGDAAGSGAAAADAPAAAAAAASGSACSADGGVSQEGIRLGLRDAAAAGLKTQCACASCARTGGRKDAAGSAGSAASAGAAAVAGAADDGGLHWAPGPTRQLLHFIARAMALWVPGVARLAVAMMRAPTVGDGYDVIALRLAMVATKWVPPVMHVTASPEGGAGGSAHGGGSPACGAADGCGARGTAAAWYWWPLPGGHWDIHELLGLVTLRLQVMGSSESSELKYEELVEMISTVRSTAELVQPVISAMAGGGGGAPCRGSEGGAKPVLQGTEELRPVDLGEAVAGASAAPAARAAPVGLPDSPCGTGLATAGEVGPLLLAASKLAALEQAVLPACSNPRCCGVEGDSEAELPLRACRGCRVARYCGQECQRAHWRAGHREECGRLQGRGEDDGQE